MPVVIAHEGGPVPLPDGIDRQSVINHLIRYSAASSFPCFRIKKGALYAAEVVGTIQLGKLRLSILPKTDSGTEARGKDFLLNLLRASGYIGMKSATTMSSVRTTTLDPLETMLSEIANEILDALSDGAPRRYEEKSFDSETIRGRIDFSQLARRLPGASPLIPIRYAPFSVENKLSRVVFWVARSLLLMSRSAAIRSTYQEILSKLGVIETSLPSLAELSSIRLSRFEARFERTLAIAHLLAERRFIDPTFAGRTDAFGMLFPLQHLFERALRTILSDAATTAGITATHKSERLYFLTDSNQSDILRLKPDYIFLENGQVVMIGDAKWKRLTETERAFGIDRNDAYQMNAYLTRYAIDCAVLFVPRTNWMPAGWQASYNIPVVDRKLHLLSIDIESLVSQVKLVRDPARIQLSNCLSSILGAKLASISSVVSGNSLAPSRELPQVE